MTQTLTCTIPGLINAYEIEIGAGLLDKQARYLSTLAVRFAIISDDMVAGLYGQHLLDLFTSANLDAHLFCFPHGEHNKTRETKAFLEDQLLENGFGRDTCVIALGGGVVTDIAGYVAATYCRGVPLVMMPTSLLGMVDASIGGKAGVNVAHGKNLLGCIYQPKKVVIDLATLKTLPRKKLSEGVVEMIKHGVIADNSFFEYLANHADKILAQDLDVLGHAIFESCRIKKEIVEQDEKETGKRRLLNFGHTIGHALERLTDFSLSHGEAVAIGIFIESYLSLQLGILDKESFEKIRNILARYGLPMRIPFQIPVQTLLEAMALDKKSQRGRPRFIILKKIGEPLNVGDSFCSHVDESLLIKILNSALLYKNSYFFSGKAS